MNQPVVDPIIVRRNRILGLILGAVAMAITAIFMYQFTARGLPQDADVFRRTAREGRAGHPLGETTEISTIPATPTPSAPEETSP